MTKRPRVSVLMKCYNHEEFVGEAIESVLNQTYKDFEFIVADNGSTDQSGKIIDSYKGRIKILRMKHNDPHRCEQLLWDNATGEYVSSICSDDWWEETKLEKQMLEVDKRPEGDFFFTWAKVAEGDLKNVTNSGRFVVLNTDKKKWFSQLFLEGTCFEGSSLLAKNNGVYQEVFLSYEKYRQLPDLASYFNMVLNKNVYVVEEYLVKHRVHNKNVSTPCPENVQRALTEDAHIRKYFFDRISDEIFLEAFRDHISKEIDENDPIDIMCNKILFFFKYAEDKWWLGQAALEYCWEHYDDIKVVEITV